MQNNPNYPPSPQISDYSFLQPSSNFIKNVSGVFTSILIFVVCYLLLISLGGVILWLCLLGAYNILAAMINWVTVLVALGIIASGGMFFIFLVKFIFIVKKDENVLRYEITPEEHPKLFEFINKITDEVKAPKPQKIFLIPDVNASVFYNSSFWSMFLPVRKNLQIGLGLVNSVNISEFKAIMAHEFGHFSQRSMKLGSYVYTVNHIIYNLVYMRDRWDQALDSWSRIGSEWGTGNVFAFFAMPTRFLVSLIRKILEALYKFINKRYMGLSREMEYNADLMAVSAVGNEAAISALRRVDIGAMAYNRTLSYLNSVLAENKLTENIYSLQRSFLEKICHENSLEIKQGLPIVNDEFTAKIVPQSRIVYRNQWASHPDQDEREANMKILNLNAAVSDDSPWVLFEDVEKWQKNVTSRLYVDVVEKEKTYSVLTDAEVLEDVDQYNAQYVLPEKYGNFYLNRTLFDLNTDEVIEEYKDKSVDFEDVYNDENTRKINLYFNNMNDLAILEQIRDKHIETESFDFDGEKFKRQYAGEIAEKLNTEIENQREWFKEIEKKAFGYNYRLAQNAKKETEFLNKYNDYNNLSRERDKYGELVVSVRDWLYRMQTKERWDEYDMPILHEGMKELHTKVIDALELSNSLVVPSKIRKIELNEGYRNYLMTEQIADLSNGFEEQRFWVMYNQIHELHDKSYRLCIESLYELINYQADL
jgi:Zn-dependent protease with chaperone function